MKIGEVMQMAPVIPVLVVKDVAHGLPVAQALVKGGLPVLEVTLRTEAALDVIREMSKVEGSYVGAGTVLNENQLGQAIDAGSQFIVSPGLTVPLGKAAIRAGVPFLPGVATAGDIMRGFDLGLDRFKFFPAEAAGGIPALKALCAPCADARFCPTGGITPQTAANWLALPAVLCIGGSWIVPPGDLDLAGISERARAATALR